MDDPLLRQLQDLCRRNATGNEWLVDDLDENQLGDAEVLMEARKRGLKARLGRFFGYKTVVNKISCQILLMVARCCFARFVEPHVCFRYQLAACATAGIYIYIFLIIYSKYFKIQIAGILTHFDLFVSACNTANHR